jgi:hypothetical protein
MGLNDGGSSAMMMVMLFPESVDGAGSSVSIDCAAGWHAANTKLGMTMMVRKNNVRVFVDIGPPVNFIFANGVLLHVLPLLLRFFKYDFAGKMFSCEPYSGKITNSR